MEIKLTVVELDVFNSKEHVEASERGWGGGPEATRSFYEKVKDFVKKSFDTVMPENSRAEYEIFQWFQGDAFRMSFEDPMNAYNFVQQLCKDFEEYSRENPDNKKLLFHISAATGKVDVDISKSEYDPNKLIRDTVLRRSNRLLEVAEPGWFYIDHNTYENLTTFVSEKFINLKIKDEINISAWRCRLSWNEQKLIQQVKTITRKTGLCFTEDLGDGVKLEMVLIKGGTFTMGSPETEEGSRDNERPQHQVTVPTFFMGKYQVTQAQWRAVASLTQVKRELKPEPSYFKGDRRPVELVSWYDAVEFCDRLVQKTGLQYRLPSEAEWEYACRAGTTTPFHFGNTITTDLANYQGTDCEEYSGSYGDGPKGVYRKETTDVGSFDAANAFGLYDMHGNVWEWCLDDWHSNYEGAPTDGSAWIENNEQEDESDNHSRVLRGGSWSIFPGGCRSACRLNFVPVSDVNYSLGFRLVCGIARRAL
ncbi:MAG: formylglycine-generating enzyme family protein [Cyanobacteria bacterium J06639_18]